MKPSPQYDFPVTVRLQSQEEEPKVSRLYRRIFDMRLNYTFSIMFVPEFEINFDNFWAQVPDDSDNISTELAARSLSISISEYTVTPNLELAGKDKLIPPEEIDFEKNELFKNIKFYQPQPRVLFLITPQEFRIFSTELYKIARKTPFIHDSVKISEIANLEVIKFLYSRIIRSPYFAETDLQMLGRERARLKTY